MRCDIDVAKLFVVPALAGIPQPRFRLKAVLQTLPTKIHSLTGTALNNLDKCQRYAVLVVLSIVTQDLHPWAR